MVGTGTSNAEFDNPDDARDYAQALRNRGLEARDGACYYWLNDRLYSPWPFRFRGGAF